MVPALIEGAWLAVVRRLKDQWKSTWFSQYDYEKLVPVAVLFGFDMPALVAAGISAEKAVDKGAVGARPPCPPGAGATKTAKKKPAKKKVPKKKTAKKKTAKKADGGPTGPGRAA